MTDDKHAQPRTLKREPDFDVFEALITLGRNRRLLVLVPLACAALAAVVSFALPKEYLATTRVLPPQQGQSATAAILSQLGGGVGGLATAALPLKNPSDLYVGLLKSDTVADALIARFDLRKVYDVKYQVDARLALQKRSRFVAEKSGIIAIEVEARDPRLAADVANAYVAELHRLTNTLAVGEASQRRLFFERQLQQTKEKLADAEVKLHQAIESGGLVSVEAQSRATVETVARLRAQIVAREVQLGAMRAYATPNNPDVRRGEQEVASLKKELSRLESGLPVQVDESEAPAESARGVGNIRLLRDVKYSEVMFELLAKQYEMARAEESKEAPLIQLLDRASPPEKKSKPRRALIVVTATLAGFAAAVGLSLLRADPFRPAPRRPREEQLQALKESWGLVRRRAS